MTVTNLTGAALLIDITTNGAYSLYDNTGTSPYTVNKSIPNNVCSVFDVILAADGSTVVLSYIGGMSTNVFS